MTPAAAVDEAEFRARCRRAQALMAQEGLSALMLTTEADIAYLTGFRTRFWESPTRPWFLLLPHEGEPVAVVPEIGADLMGRTWVEDVRTWPAPHYTDDGVGLLGASLSDMVPAGGAIGLPSGQGTHLRMPLDDWAALRERLPDRRFGSDAGVMRRLRMVKSEAEIALIAAACATANRAFARLPEIAAAGVPLGDVFRRFQILCLEEGADRVAYLAGGAGRDGYTDVISPASNRALEAGEVLMLDTGLERGGYFCDFDRNISLGPASPSAAAAHSRLVEATRAGFERARPGATASELFHAMQAMLGSGTDGAKVGRYGHGLGLQLTEPPSLHPDDHTVLAPGMVLTLEPSVELGPGRMMVHEENIVIRDGPAEWLSTPAPDRLRTV
ncbi:peptidase M24 [Brevirhabdus pacifica]|uniref:Peptidase M24 n=1 Tax=Brevirhabdus pacifica TaxID=1267768 RepID=A0A1U7DGW8_9RHOB|nr:M24 family metallopeptidase [Brevirhabdus pacifica]APX89244.1 peptidase M24 [Brevirhabdus pacifica]OWU76711.1 peptidase M24 [Loktanella sp. 22II-4b]PJJ86149.1 Xaa-Pro aminopeptidase [Brevirhabdus pacifica]